MKLYVYRAIFKRYTAWTSITNDSYGELIGAMNTREVEMGFAFFIPFKERLNHLSVITQISELR